MKVPVSRSFLSLFALCALLSSGVARAIPHVLLVQNSGWMEPFYTDPKSPFKPLVAALAGSVVRPGDALVLASFSQALPGAPSPHALLSLEAKGPEVRGRVAQALAPLAVARKPGGNAMADTDMGEAVRGAASQALGGKPGIVWLVTNNRNNPNHDQEAADRNRAFYGLVHGEGPLSKALAFPLPMPVQGQHHRANGLMVYAFAFGEQGAAALDALVAAGRVRDVISEAPARLKPLERDAVRLAPRRVVNTPGVAFSLAPNGVLRADVDPEVGTAQARIEWHLENTVYPYTIAAATLGARSALAGEAHPIALDATRVRNLEPGRPAPMASSLVLPVAQIPGRWSWAALASSGSAHVLPGTIELQLADQQLLLSHAFRQRMATLFPGDPLPEVFIPPSKAQASRVTLPVEVRIHYGMGPLLTLGGALLVLVAGIAIGLWALARKRGSRRFRSPRNAVTPPLADPIDNEQP